MPLKIQIQSLLTSSNQKEEVLNVFLTAFLPQDRFSIDQLSDYFNKKIIPRLEKGQIIQSASDHNKMIGFALFEKWDRRSYYLAEMAVLPNYQRQGIGKQLVFSILEKEPAINRILLVTEKANQWSQSFYEKIGFKRSPFQHPDYPENFIGFEFSR